MIEWFHGPLHPNTLKHQNSKEVFIHRRSTPRPQGYLNHPGVHPSLSKATDYDRQRRQGGRTTINTQLPDYYA